MGKEVRAALQNGAHPYGLGLETPKHRGGAGGLGSAAAGEELPSVLWPPMALNPALPLSSCVNLGKLPDLSEPTSWVK